MRYILDNEGYMYDVSFGAEISCSLGNCTEYTGKVPEGYETLEEWHDDEIEKLNAWKIVEGDLVFDANKYDEIQSRIAIENEENSYVTHKELSMIKQEQDENLKRLYDEKSVENTYLNRLNTINNSANMQVEKLDIRTKTTITDNVKLFFTSANMLPNNLTSTSLNGLTITQNNDKSIQITGTSTSDCEINLGGSYEQTDSIFYFLQNVSYLLNGLVSGVSVRFYDYDGTDRTLIGDYVNEATINFEADKKITQTTLFIASDTTLDATIYPMLQEIDQLALDSGEITPYEPYKSNSLKIPLGTNELKKSDNLIIEDGKAILIKDRFLTVDETVYNTKDTLYFNFPDDLYKKLPSEETTIIRWSWKDNTLVYNRLYVSDKKIYLNCYTSSAASTKITLYDKENNINLTSYKLPYTVYWYESYTDEINTLEDIYSYVSLTPFDEFETIDLGYVKMPNTYYHITNVYSDKATETIVFYRNVEKLNTEVVKIGTFTINDNSLTSDITTEYDFTEDDLNKVRQYINGEITLTYTEKLKYDVNGDGVINPQDMLLIRKAILANITSTEPGRLEINSSSPYKTILLTDKDGNEVVNISLLGVKVPSLNINGREYGEQEILWQGAMFMRGNQSIDLSETVSSQPNGIVLVFSEYANGEAQSWNFSCHFVPKLFVELLPGGGHSFFLNNSKLGLVGTKYLYIGDTRITGNDANDDTGTGGSGITYTNNRWVLRYVIGV